MCCNDCTQHVLDGPLSVCTLVELCCAHVLVCQCLSCVAILARQLKQTPFYPRNGSLHFFSFVTFVFEFVLFLFIFFSLVTVTIGRQCHVSVPNNEKNPLQSWSVCRWDQCECPGFDDQYNHNHTYCICIFLDLTLFPFPTSSGTSLRVEIQNSKWKLSGYVMGETLVSDRWLQNTSCVRGRSVWCRRNSRIQTYRFCALKCTEHLIYRFLQMRRSEISPLMRTQPRPQSLTWPLTWTTQCPYSPIMDQRRVFPSLDNWPVSYLFCWFILFSEIVWGKIELSLREIPLFKIVSPSSCVSVTVLSPK